MKFIRVGVDYPNQGGKKKNVFSKEILLGFEKSQEQKKGKNCIFKEMVNFVFKCKS
jgi:hypothetical protein